MLQPLLDNNRKWAEKMRKIEPDFFSKLSHLQQPGYLWIGCSDSRVPANEIVGLLPGELFVHRNVGNVVAPGDLNCLSVLQYAVDVLKVKDVIVTGHYGCGGIKAAMDNARLGLIDKWLSHIQDVAKKHHNILNALPNDQDRLNRLCELNVIEQAFHVCQTPIVLEAWARGQSLTVHTVIYDIHDGLLRDLGFSVRSQPDVVSTYTRIIR